MAFTAQKAEDHLTSGRFNTASASNQTLIDYGDYFAKNVGRGAATLLLQDIVVELRLRHQGKAKPKFNGPLTNYEIKKLGDYCRLTGQPNYFCNIPEVVKVAKNTKIDHEAVALLYDELSQTYNTLGNDFNYSPKKIADYWHACANTISDDESMLLSNLVMSVLLLIHSICTKLTADIGNIKENPGNASLEALLLVNNEFVNINLMKLFNTIFVSPNDNLLKEIGEYGPAPLAAASFNVSGIVRVGGVTTYALTSFKELYTILSKI